MGNGEPAKANPRLHSDDDDDYMKTAFNLP